MPVIEAINIRAPLLYLHTYINPYIARHYWTSTMCRAIHTKQSYEETLPPFSYPSSFLSLMYKYVLPSYCGQLLSHPKPAQHISGWDITTTVVSIHVLLPPFVQSRPRRRRGQKVKTPLQSSSPWTVRVWVYSINFWYEALNSSLLKACKRWVVAETFGLHEKEKSLLVKTEDENAIHPRTVSQLAESCIDDVHMPLLFRAGRNFVLDFCRWGELKQQNGWIEPCGQGPAKQGDVMRQIQICTSTTLPVDKHNLLQARQAFRDAFNKRFSRPDEPSRSIELFRSCPNPSVESNVWSVLNDFHL